MSFRNHRAKCRAYRNGGHMMAQAYPQHRQETLMSETQGQHTPGPWTVEGKYYIATPHKVGNVAFVYAKGNPLYDQFANVTGYDDPDQAEANARLIACAPELLAACENFTEFSFAAEESKGDYAGALREFCRLKRAARAVLQKAKGD